MLKLKVPGLILCVYLAMSPMWVALAEDSLSTRAPVLTRQYVGSKVCADCHKGAYEQWRRSDHFRAMQLPGKDTVLGDFASGEAAAKAAPHRFYQTEAQYLVTLPVAGEPRTLEVKYTFGHAPLQQYLVELVGGRLQALNTAWDTRPKDQGGQRWFNLQENLPADSPFEWNRHLQNWNTRCAECHSTNVDTGFDPETLSYQTSFSEVNIGCEACHGPGADHVASARASKSPETLTSSYNTPAALSWAFREGEAIATPQGQPANDYLDMCGGCHSRRSVIGHTEPGERYSDQYLLSLLDAGLYYPDGQIQDEVFVMGSYLQSKMFRAGVTCMNCHDAHTGKVQAQDNRLCTQCHQSGVFEAGEHLLHAANTPGGFCVDCHMPETTYMSVDARRDHRFGIPNPALSASLGVPNACASCHADKSAQWAAGKLTVQAGDDEYALINNRLRKLDPLVAPDAWAYISDVSHPGIKRATLLDLLPVGDESVRLAFSLLDNSDDLIRRAAVNLIGRAPGALSLALQSGKIDESRSVRFAAGRALATNLQGLGSASFSGLQTWLDEYRRSLELTRDMPSTQTEIAMLDLAQGDLGQARSGLERAIRIEPHFVPALLNLADIHRSEGEAASAGKLLEKALAVAPDSAAANHSYGLYLVRQGKVEDALVFLEAATQQADVQPRYLYVYAVGLDSVQQTATAVQVLRQASVDWPNQYDLLMLEVMYREKTGLLSGIKRPLRALAKLAPGDTAVQRRLQYYNTGEPGGG